MAHVCSVPICVSPFVCVCVCLCSRGWEPWSFKRVLTQAQEGVSLRRVCSLKGGIHPPKNEAHKYLAVSPHSLTLFQDETQGTQTRCEPG